MNIEDINFDKLSALVQVRSHLVFLLNNGSRSLVTKNEVRKIQNLLTEIDKYFIKQTLMSEDDSVPLAQTTASNLPTGNNEVIVTQGTVLVNPKPFDANQLHLSFLNDVKASSAVEKNTTEEKSPVEEKKINKKASKKLFSRTDE